MKSHFLFFFIRDKYPVTDESEPYRDDVSRMLGAIDPL